MALYRENATGFLCEFASNPGASYTAVTAQPTDTVTNRVNWWRARNVDSALGQSSTWHPSLQQASGYVEDPNPTPVIASGINIIPARYCAFDETNGLPTIAKSASSTLSQVSGGFYSDKKLRVVTSTINQYFFLQAATTNYTIKLEPGRYWMLSFYAAPTTNAAVTINAVLRVKNSVSYTDHTVVVTTSATSGAWTRLAAGFDLSANSTDNTAQLYLRMSSAVTVDFDAFMLEEYDGSHLVPSAWYKPGGTTDIDGRSILPNTITDTTPFASSLSIPTIVSTLPTTGNYTGRLVFLTSDGKLYRYNGSAWVASVPAADVTGQLTDAQIAAIAAAKMTGTITSTQIGTDAVTSPKIIAGAVIAGKVAAGAITAGTIAANAVTATTIEAGAIVAGKIAANAVTAGTIAANAVIAGTIQAGAIGADEIAANSITTDKLTLTGSNLIANSAFATGTNANWMPWNAPSAQSIYAPVGAPAKYCMRFQYSGAATSVSIWAAAKAYSAAGADEDGFEVVGGQQYQANIHAVRSADYASAGLVVRGYFWMADGTYTTSVLIINQPTVATSWTDYSGTFTVPANALRCWMYVQSLNQTAGSLYFTNMRVHRRMSSELIVDGSIIADKMAANSITAANGAIENLAVTNAKIADLSASKLTAGTINAATITVTNLNASNLTVGTINGSRYGDDSIDGRPITPGAIHRTVSQLNSYEDAPYWATLATIGPTGGNAWIGPITVTANTYRTAVLLMAVFSDYATQPTTTDVVMGMCRGSQSDAGLLGRTRHWTKYAGLYMPNSYMFLDTTAGTGTVSYYLGVHQTVSELGTIPCHLSLIALELSK